jgi:hypothetical protein
MFSDYSNFVRHGRFCQIYLKYWYISSLVNCKTWSKKWELYLDCITMSKKCLYSLYIRDASWKFEFYMDGYSFRCTLTTLYNVRVILISDSIVWNCAPFHLFVMFGLYINMWIIEYCSSYRSCTCTFCKLRKLFDDFSIKHMYTGGHWN